VSVFQTAIPRIYFTGTPVFFAGAMDGFAMEAIEKHGWRTWISAGIVRRMAARFDRAA